VEAFVFLFVCHLFSLDWVCSVSVEFAVAPNTVREHGRGRRGEGDAPVDISGGKLSGESPHYLVFIVCRDGTDKRA
jgi:hypothetical protein